MNAVEILALGSSPKRAASAEVGAPNNEDTSFLGEIEALDDEAPVPKDVKPDAEAGRVEAGEEGDLEEGVPLVDPGQADTQTASSEEGLVDAIRLRPVDAAAQQAGAEDRPHPGSLSLNDPSSKEAAVGRDRATIPIAEQSKKPGTPGEVAATSERLVQPSAAAAEGEEIKPGQIEAAPANARSAGQQMSQDGSPGGQGKDQRQLALFGELDGQQRSEMAASKSISGAPSFGLEMSPKFDVQQFQNLGRASDLALQRSVDEHFVEADMRPRNVDAPAARTAIASEPSLTTGPKGVVPTTADGLSAFSGGSLVADVSPFGQGMSERLAASSSTGLSNVVQLQTPQGLNSSQIAQAISLHLDAAPKSGEPGHLELRLEPEELGKLRITFTPRETGFLVSFTAERSETLDLIRRNGEALLEDFEKIDLGGSELAFDMQGDDQDWQRADEAGRQFSEQSNPDLEPSVSRPIILAGIGDDRLGIRL